MTYTTTKPPWWVTKKYLREVNHDLQQQLAHAQQDVIRLRSETAIKDEQARQWRSAYETVTNTPEIKADTEAAFKRGERQQQRKFAAWLQSQAYAVLTVADADD